MAHSLPPSLKYTHEHEWVEVRADDTVRIGITDYAQAQLGDVVYVQLPEVGETLSAGEPCGEIESTKSVSELFSPFNGEVVGVNGSLEDAPEAVNSDPYGDGWMIEVCPTDDSALDSLLDSETYASLVGEQ